VFDARTLISADLHCTRTGSRSRSYAGSTVGGDAGVRRDRLVEPVSTCHRELDRLQIGVERRLGVGAVKPPCPSNSFVIR